MNNQRNRLAFSNQSSNIQPLEQSQSGKKRGEGSRPSPRMDLLAYADVTFPNNQIMMPTAMSPAKPPFPSDTIRLTR